MSKDQVIGTLIVIACVVLIFVYLSGLFLYDPYIKGWLNLGSAANVQFWLIAIPVIVAFVAILLIGAWIGYTMASTPAPKPIEEITAEVKQEAESTVTENKTSPT